MNELMNFNEVALPEGGFNIEISVVHVHYLMFSFTRQFAGFYCYCTILQRLEKKLYVALR